MGQLLDTIRADQLEARKSNDKVKSALLAIIIGTVTQVPKAKKLGKDEAGQDIYEKVEADLSDANVIKTIKQVLGGAESTKAALEAEFQRVMGHPSNDGKTRPLSAEGRVFMEGIVPKMRQADYEIKILSSYVPAQLTEDRLREIIAEQKAGGANIGAIMGHLKANYAGLYDGAVASRIAKE